jgi:hypothetical protein
MEVVYDESGRKPWASPQPTLQQLCYRTAGRSVDAERLGRPHSKALGSSRVQVRQETDAWRTRGRVGARRCGNYIWPKDSLEIAGDRPGPGSTVRPVPR